MLIVIVKLPVFLKHPGTTTVNISTNVTFSCTAKGFNITDVIWRKVGSSRLPLAATVTIKRSPSKVRSILKITNAAGYYTGKYYCKAINTAGQTSSNQADLIVQGDYALWHITILTCIVIKYGSTSIILYAPLLHT